MPSRSGITSVTSCCVPTNWNSTRSGTSASRMEVRHGLKEGVSWTHLVKRLALITRHEAIEAWSE